MRSKLIVLVAALAATGVVAAGDMTLGRDGSLYRVAAGDDGLVITQSTPNGSPVELLVPQTTGTVTSSLQIAVDEASGTVIVAWQEDEGGDARVLLAGHNQGTWQGPVVIAGDAGLSASNPELMIHRATSVVEEDDGPVEYATSIVHLAWWEGLELEGGGLALYASAPVDDSGLVDWSELSPLVLHDLIPFGIGCEAIEDPTNLAHPTLFVDSETGDPHVLAVDVPSCLFQIVQLHPELRDDEGEGKRRRHVIVFGRTAMIAVDPDLPLHTSAVEVGHGLQVVIRWDEADTIHYVYLAEQGWSEEHTLAFGDSLSHERAVDLIRGLAR